MFKYFVKRFLGCVDSFCNDLVLRNNHVIVGKNLVINGRIRVSNSGSLVIGNNVTINSGAWYSPIGGHTKTVFIVYAGGSLKIGNSVGISNSTIVVQESITIGDGTLIGGSCNIWDTDFHSLDAKVRGTVDDRGATRPVRIGEHTFISAHSILLKGSTIGDRAIVGAGSVASFKLGSDEIFKGR